LLFGVDVASQCPPTAESPIVASAFDPLIRTQVANSAILLHFYAFVPFTSTLLAAATTSTVLFLVVDLASFKIRFAYTGLAPSEKSQLKSAHSRALHSFVSMAYTPVLPLL
jgi:hypothetical protein